MILFQSGTTEAVEGFEAFEPITFLQASVRLRVPSAVIGKGKKVSLARKSNRVDRVYQVCMYELGGLLGSLLWLSIIDFCGLGLLATVADVAF